MNPATEDFLNRTIAKAIMGEGPVELRHGERVLGRYETIDAGFDAWAAHPDKREFYELTLRPLDSPARREARRKEEATRAMAAEMGASLMRGMQDACDEMLVEALRGQR
jgi:hypothetical protein